MNIKAKLSFIFIVSFFLFCSCDYEFYTQGQRIYQAHCENCHMAEGEGLKKLIPDISKSAFMNMDPQSLICLLRKGKPQEERNDGLQMPTFPQLNQVEMCNLVNYIHHKWNDDFKEIKIIEMDGLEKHCQ